MKLNITEGQIDTEIYKGKVYIYSYINSCSDLYVEHDFIENWDVFNCPADNDEFKSALTELLFNETGISISNLERCELGMQNQECAVFEDFFSIFNGTNYGMPEEMDANFIKEKDAN